MEEIIMRDILGNLFLQLYSKIANWAITVQYYFQLDLIFWFLCEAFTRGYHLIKAAIIHNLN